MTSNPNRLLIIDDEPEICSFVGDVAEAMGFDVAVANQPEEFWDAYYAFAPTGIVLDLQMPEADGVELLRVLADADCRTQIVLMSGVDTRVLATARRLGDSRGLRMLGTLKKPFTVEDLEAMLGKLMQADLSVTEEDLRQAIAAGQLIVHYQPKVDVKSEPLYPVESAEALVRWEHPRHGLLAPARFIPLAEDTGLIAPLTDFVMEEAIRQVGLWQEAGTPLAVAVNLAPQLLDDLEFPDRLSGLLSKYGAAGSNLILEITESGAMADAERTMDVLTRFRLKGIGLSIDDFGTGYSSLVQLHRLPFSELKIDQSFIMELHSDEEAKIIVRSIIALGRSMGLSVCAEGVETQQALEFLRSVGCEKAQGYFISKPIPPAEMPPFVRRWDDERSAQTDQGESP